MSTIRLNRLTGPEVLALHNIARADRRLDRHGRIILAEIARTGRVIDHATLAKAVQLKQGAAGVAQRIEKLIEFGYLPAKAARR